MSERIYLAMGCFWGAEEIFWQIPGVEHTAVGYMGGATQNPTYEQVCSGTTGHTETVLVDYDPAVVDTREILRTFWEHHDPTQGNRQGNDIGTQYRSAIFTSSDAQAAVADETLHSYQSAIDERGYGAITTSVHDASDHVFWPAEDYHQEYLKKNPFGYRCHANTGVPLPVNALS